MESSIETEERAAAWLAKRDSGEWSPQDEAALAHWLAESTANRVAYLRMEAAWEGALRLQALSAGVSRGSVPSPDDWYQAQLREKPANVRQGRGRRAKLAAIAASLLVLAGAAISWQRWNSGAAYSTPVGGTATVPMADGSQITLNTDTEVRVAVTREERRVHLEHGEAFFDVAKDPHRPFVVQAGSERVIAIGTKFSVRRDAGGVRVVVTEGAVRMEGSGAIVEAPLGAGTVALASAGQMLRETKPLTEVEDYVRWRSGLLVFRDVTLAEAVAEFNRYNSRQIVIEDGAVAGMRIAGSFRATNVEEFLQLLERGYPLRADRTGGRVILAGTH